MDPTPRAFSPASETPSHETVGAVGGDTLKIGVLPSDPGTEVFTSEHVVAGFGDNMENDVNMEAEDSFNLSTMSGPKGDICDGMAADMSTGGNPVTPVSNLNMAGNTSVTHAYDEPKYGFPQDNLTQKKDAESSYISGNETLYGIEERDTEDGTNHRSMDGTGRKINNNLSMELHLDDYYNNEQLSETVGDQPVLDSNDVPPFETENLETEKKVPQTDDKLAAKQSEIQPIKQLDISFDQEDRSSDTNIQNPQEHIEGGRSDSQESQATEITSEATAMPDEEAEEDIVFDFSGDANDDVIAEMTMSVKLSEETVVYFNDQQCVQIMGNLREQRMHGVFCDATIRVQDTTYKAHRCVLASNGTVLHSMVKDTTLDVIDLTETVNNSKAFDSILEYLYTGQMSVSMAIVSDIMASCRKLGIPDVSQCCFLHIEKNININSWAHILDLSLNYDFPDIAQKVVKFFADNLRHLYKMKEAMYFSPEQLEQILRKSNQRHLPEIELHKLDLALHWVVSDYDNRGTMLPSLLQYIRLGLITREGLEGVFRQKTIKDHQVFKDQTVQMFLSDVRECLIARRKAQKLARKPRKAIRPIKISTRGRPRKMVDYSAADNMYIGTDDSSVELPDRDIDYIPGLPVEPVIVLKKKRGRPPKKRDPYAITTKRPRGRPRRNLRVERQLKKNLTFSEIQVKQELVEVDLAATADDVTVVMPEDADVKPDAGTLSKTATRLMTSKGKYHTTLLYKLKKKARARIMPGADGHFDCLTCGKKFTLRKQLTRHRIIHREKTKVCDLCDYKTTRNDKVRDHIRRVHTEEAVQRGFLTPEEREHRLEMAANKPQIRSPRKPRAKKMTEPFTDEQMIQCQKCPRKFQSVSALRHHMKGHGSETPFLCEVCGFSTRHFASINVHKRQHNGKKFRCTFPGCTYENIRKSRLDDHQNAHTGIKNHVCSVCGKAFAGRKHMQRHEKTHLEIKPLNCEHCEYATTRGDKLREHIRKHHRDMAIIMGILDPNKVPEIKEPKPPRIRKPRKKKVKTDVESARNLLIDETVSSLMDSTPDSSLGVSRQETNQAANFVTMSVAPHLLGASTISEDMIQYLASMTPNTSLSVSHPQIHASISVPGGPQQNSQHSHLLSNVPVSQSPAVAVPVHATPQQLVRGPHSQQITDIRGDTWIYHIVPESQHQY